MHRTLFKYLVVLRPYYEKSSQYFQYRMKLRQLSIYLSSIILRLIARNNFYGDSEFNYTISSDHNVSEYGLNIHVSHMQ